MNVCQVGMGGIPHLSFQMYLTQPSSTLLYGLWPPVGFCHSVNRQHKQETEEREESEARVFISQATSLRAHLGLVGSFN